jgi:hypothetical protein
MKTDQVRKSAPLAPMASCARKGFGPRIRRTHLSIFQKGMLVSRGAEPGVREPQKRTSSTNDQWSLTGTGIRPSAHNMRVIADGSGSTVSHSLLISCGNAGCATPTPSSFAGKPDVTERISIPGKAARNSA